MRRASVRATVFVSVLAMACGVVAVAPSTASAAPKDPVVIVAGTFSPGFANEPLRWRLSWAGYDAYIFQLPGLGLGPIEETSAGLGPFVDQVLAQTGAEKVDLVGHSQGGLVGRYYIKYLGGDQTVDSMVSLGAPHYGTVLANIGTILGFGSCIGIEACVDMGQGSDFLDDLNAGDDTIGSVDYTNIYTVFDEFVRPVRNATLRDGATNVKVQDQCWFRIVGHIGLITDGTVADGVLDALRHDNVRLNCWAW